MLEISLDSYDHDSSIPHTHAFCDISEDLKTASDDCCPVCLEDDSPDTMLLPCSHEFHGECILKWVELNFSCPLCRQQITQFVPLEGQTLNERFVTLWDEYYVEKKDQTSSITTTDNVNKNSTKTTAAATGETITNVKNNAATVVRTVDINEATSIVLTSTLEEATSSDMNSATTTLSNAEEPIAAAEVPVEPASSTKIPIFFSIPDFHPYFPENYETKNIANVKLSSQFRTSFLTISIPKNLNNFLLLPSAFTSNQIIFGSLLTLQSLHSWKVILCNNLHDLGLRNIYLARMNQNQRMVMRSQTFNQSQRLLNPKRKLTLLQLKRHNMSLLTGQNIYSSGGMNSAVANQGTSTARRYASSAFKKVNVRTKALKSIAPQEKIKKYSTKQKAKQAILQNVRPHLLQFGLLPVALCGGIATLWHSYE